jgi:hydrogenase-4 component E
MQAATLPRERAPENGGTAAALASQPWQAEPTRADGFGPKPDIPCPGPLHASRVAGRAIRGGATDMNPLFGQFINLLGAVLLLLAFAMISQRRVLSLIHLFTLQGATLVLATAVVGHVTDQPHLYLSAGITLILKVMLIPWLLHRVIARLNVRWDVETLINIPTTMLLGILLVIFAFNLALPIAQFSSTISRGSLGIALACVLLSFLMMITRAKAVPQVIGFLSMENGLFFAATSATYGMPMVVELGIALDVLIGVLILGVFLFQIREQFDSLDIRHLERLKEE